MLTLIKPGCGEVEREKRMDQVIGRALQERDAEVEVLGTAEELAEADLAGQTVIFAICLSVSGMNMNSWAAVRALKTLDIPGSCTEGQISHVLSERFSRDPAGWSRKVLGKLCQIRVYRANGNVIAAEDLKEHTETERYHEQ